MNAKRKLVAGLVAGLLVAIPVADASAHQHLFNPSGTCPSENASVPQGTDNPAGNTPGGRNNANANAKGADNCKNA